MSFHRVCCCGGAPCPIACCDFWGTCGFTPTSIVISASLQLLRDYSNGQTIVVEETQWTITSVGGFTVFGTNCLLEVAYGARATQATLTYVHKLNLWAPDVFQDSTYDGDNGTTTFQECSGCEFTEGAPSCDLAVTYCLHRSDVEEFAGTLTNAAGILQYRCTHGCEDECAAPLIAFVPPTPTVTGTARVDFGCCTSEVDTDPDPASILFGLFEIIGAPGCESATTWDGTRIHCGASGTVCPPNPFTLCVSMTSCEPIVGTSYNAPGSETFTWICESYFPDPENPTVIECTKTLTYDERCVRSLTVTVS